MCHQPVQSNKIYNEKSAWSLGEIYSAMKKISILVSADWSNQSLGEEAEQVFAEREEPQAWCESKKINPG